MTTFDAAMFARGWLATSIAASTDDGRPALNRTVCIEAHPTGVRLISTDSYMLLRAWVPNRSHEYDRNAGEPLLEEAPHATAVAMDPHGRASGLLKHAIKLAKDAGEHGPTVELRLNLDVIDAEPGALEGLEARYVTLELDGVERLKLGSYEGEFPNWRHLRHETADTSVIALNPDIAARLGRLGTILPSSLLAFRWGGPDKVAAVTATAAEPAVTGLVMPCRWDLERDAPDLGGQQTTDEGHADAAADPLDPDLVADAARAVVAAELGSTSLIQRRLKIGFSKAGRIMDVLETGGVIGPAEGTRARHVLVDDAELDDLLPGILAALEIAQEADA